MEEVHKKLIDIMRFTYIDINFDVKYEGHQKCLKTLSVYILRVNISRCFVVGKKILYIFIEPFI